MVGYAPESETIVATPILEAKNSSGRKKFWQAYGIRTPDGIYCYYTDSWQELTDGGFSAHNISETNKVSAKNIGHANETSLEEQLISEVNSLESKKRDSGYAEEGEEPKFNLPLPMLAYKWQDRGKSMKFACYIQPKFDGFRCISNGELFWTRKGKLYLPKVVEHLRMNTNGLILDGELMLPPGHTFEQTTSAIKKFHPELTPLLCYNVFDAVPDGKQLREDSPFTERGMLVKEMLKQGHNVGVVPDQVIRVKSSLCQTREEVAAWLGKALRAGYEGIMLRNPDGLYAINQRSKDLLKFKQFEDAEFEIVDVCDGRGREEGAIIYVCVTSEGARFNVRPKGTIEERKDIWERCKNGSFDPEHRMLTVRYQELTTDGIPRFPVGITIRED